MAINGTSNKTGLPHGMVPFHQIPDPQTRDAVMKLNENIVALAKRPAGGGSAEPVVQYKDAQNLLNSIETNYPNAAAAASAISQTLSAKAAAENAASTAVSSAVNAAARSSAAEASATSASASAASAAAAALEAGGVAGCINYANVLVGAYSNYRIYMASLVDDASAKYRVQIKFLNTTSTARTVRVQLYGESVQSFALAGGLGETVTQAYIIDGGDEYFLVDNADASVQVFIKAWRVNDSEGEQQS